MKNNLTSFAAITTLSLLCFVAPLAIVSGCKTGPADSGIIETIVGGLLVLIGLVTSHIFRASDPSTVKPPTP